MEVHCMTEKEMERLHQRFEAEQRIEARRTARRELEIARELKQMELDHAATPVAKRELSRNKAKAQRKARRKQRGK
jgi:hypothetical protein